MRGLDVSDVEGKTYYTGWFETDTQTLGKTGWSVIDDESGDDLTESTDPKEIRKAEEIIRFATANFFKDLGKSLPEGISKSTLNRKLIELI
jgi:hypothetical protein